MYMYIYRHPLNICMQYHLLPLIHSHNFINTLSVFLHYEISTTNRRFVVLSWLPDKSCNERNSEVVSVHDAVVEHFEPTKLSKGVDHVQQPTLEMKPVMYPHLWYYAIITWPHTSNSCKTLIGVHQNMHITTLSSYK